MPPTHLNDRQLLGGAPKSAIALLAIVCCSAHGGEPIPVSVHCSGSATLLSEILRILVAPFMVGIGLLVGQWLLNRWRMRQRMRVAFDRQGQQLREVSPGGSWRVKFDLYFWLSCTQPEPDSLTGVDVQMWLGGRWVAAKEKEKSFGNSFPLFVKAFRSRNIRVECQSSMDTDPSTSMKTRVIFRFVSSRDVRAELDVKLVEPDHSVQ